MLEPAHTEFLAGELVQLPQAVIKSWVRYGRASSSSCVFKFGTMFGSLPAMLDGFSNLKALGPLDLPRALAS